MKEVHCFMDIESDDEITLFYFIPGVGLFTGYEGDDRLGLVDDKKTYSAFLEAVRIGYSLKPAYLCKVELDEREWTGEELGREALECMRRGDYEIPWEYEVSESHFPVDDFLEMLDDPESE